jgi:hypothetical protein
MKYVKLQVIYINKLSYMLREMTTQRNVYKYNINKSKVIYIYIALKI